MAEHHHNTFNFLDAYCERSGDPSMWAEPINTITNLAFLIAAYYGWRCYRGMDGRSLRGHGDIVALVVILASIGVGSGLWHLLAERWALLADVIPIILFINVALVSFLRRILFFSWAKTFGGWVLYQLVNVGSEMYLPRGLLHGTVMYLPTYLVLLVVLVILWKRGHPFTRHFGTTCLLWTASLIFRTIDVPTCDYALMIGTHPLWHIFNSIVLYRLISLLCRSVKERAPNDAPSGPKS